MTSPKMRRVALLLCPLLTIGCLIFSIVMIATAENCGFLNGLCPGETEKDTAAFFGFIATGVFLLGTITEVVLITLKKLRDPRNKIHLP